MRAEILCVGTELLHGDIVNTNAAFISKQLAKIGIDVHYQSVVGDNPDRMKEAYRIALNRADVIISTGGLGPTRDDITKEVVAEFFELPMVYDEESYKHMVERYTKFQRKVPENNLRQAYFPQGSKILTNVLGTANACILDRSDKRGNQKIVVLLPGPPFEMKPLLEKQVVPYLSGYSDQTVVACKIVVTELGESRAEEMVLDLIESQTNPTIATYAGKGEVLFRITAKARTKEKALELIDPVKQELLKRFGGNATLVSNDAGVEEIVAQLLLDKGITLATAESCTGGLLAGKLINFPGISKVYKEGFVTYTDESKEKRLGVSSRTLENFGAVSKETAKEMAKGVCETAGADMGVSVTGIAGPSGATAQKPVGLVYICIFYKGEYTLKELNRDGDRQTIRERAVNTALDEMRKLLLKTVREER